MGTSSSIKYFAAHLAIDGVKSVGLMKKLGMRLEGVQKQQTRDNLGNWADLYLYGILESERKNSGEGT